MDQSTRTGSARPTFRITPRPALLCTLGVLSCASDDELPIGDLGGTPTGENTALSAERGSTGSDPNDPWWCLDQAPPPLPAFRGDAVVGFVLPVVDWRTGLQLAGRGLTASLCAAVDFSCMPPLAPPYAVREGALTGVPLSADAAVVPVFEGFDGFLLFDVENPPGPLPPDEFMPTSYFLGGTVSGDISVGPRLTLTRREDWRRMIVQSFPALALDSAFASGSVITSVHDCNGQLVRDARVELSPSGGVRDGLVPFLLPASRIPIAWPPDAPLLTPASGMVGYLNAPAGAVRLLAFRPDDSEPFASAEVGVVAGQHSVVALRPAYFAGASLTADPERTLELLDGAP